MSTESVSFPDWKAALAGADLTREIKTEFAAEIVSFLSHCKARLGAATNEVAKPYLSGRETQGPGRAREVLRWFYVEGLNGLLNRRQRRRR